MTLYVKKKSIVLNRTYRFYSKRNDKKTHIKGGYVEGLFRVEG
jgi:hypothetical protein